MAMPDRVPGRFGTRILFHILLSLLALSGQAARAAQAPPARQTTVPPLAHVILVVMENHGYDQVRLEPYTASLIASGAVCTASYAVTHPSQPNYLALWSGGLQGVNSDSCAAPGSPFNTENLGHACEAAGVSWRSYAEDLPSAGWAGCSANGGLYHRRHCPWANWGNLTHLHERPYTDLAVDIANGALPRLAFVIPNNCHNTHDCTVATGDAWLAANLPAMLAAAGPAGAVILTWDEDDGHFGNRILTVLAGDAVLPGQTVARIVNHYTVLRTICDALGIAPFGLATTQFPIVDIWASQTSGAVPAFPTGAILGPAVPNPSRGTFEVRLAIDRGASQSAGIFDSAGRFVASPALEAGSTDGVIRWDGRAEDGTLAPNGLYFMRVRTGGTVVDRKLVLAR